MSPALSSTSVLVPCPGLETILEMFGSMRQNVGYNNLAVMVRFLQKERFCALSDHGTAAHKCFFLNTSNLF